MIEAAALAQNEYLAQKSDVIRKEHGQFFTSEIVADYMASMITKMEEKTIRVLDAGAGVGILTMSVALRCLDLGHIRVHAVLYEIDNDALPHLEMNMIRLGNLFSEHGGQFTFDIHHEDFILSRPDKTEEPFHISSINPPYFKYSSKTSPYAVATTDLYKGNPNIYASFMAVVSACMVKNGQMVVIVPRSFTNGLYFKGFRKYMNQTMSLNRLHIFRARNKVFKELSVLQENIICYYVKSRQTTQIDIHTSTGYEDLAHAETKEYSEELIIDKSNSHEIIRIPETPEDGKILKTVERWPSSFQDNGYYISTGPVVEHRTKEYIIGPTEQTSTIPLLRMHNIKAFKTEWTGHHKKDARFKLLDGHAKHTSENQPYVILKRFSSKDEKRRLVAGVHNNEIIEGKLVALENHLNYIGREGEILGLSEAYGLAAIFSSTFMDKYFRCISGNTQVNATEIRLLKLPIRDVIQQVVDVLIGCNFTQKNIDNIVNFHLDI